MTITPFQGVLIAKVGDLTSEICSYLGQTGGRVTISGELVQLELSAIDGFVEMCIATSLLAVAREAMTSSEQDSKWDYEGAWELASWARCVYASRRPSFQSQPNSFFDDWHRSDDLFGGKHASSHLFAEALCLSLDAETGRQSLSMLRGIQLMIAKNIFEADGRISSRERSFLARLQAKLRLSGTMEVREPFVETPLYSSTATPDIRQAIHLPIQPTHESAKSKLNALVGLGNIKAEVQRLEALLIVNSQRVKAGLPVTSQAYHFVFYGNPGTGKTTVARVLGQLLREHGILRSGHVVETDRAGLVAEYLGQTAAKCNAKIQEAMDGILFIDEAYALARKYAGTPDMYGMEAIDTLLKRMEDYRERLVVIVAGYPRPMSEFIQANPGLKSRFTKYMSFQDYTPMELVEIFLRMAKKDHYELSHRALIGLISACNKMCKLKDETFGNAREMRNIFEETLSRQALRLVGEGGNLSADRLHQIRFSDLPLELHGISWTTINEEQWSARCPSCQRSHRVSVDLVGKLAVCNDCQHSFNLTFITPVEA